MEEWKKVKLSDIIALIGGGTPKTTVKEFWDGNIPWLSVKDFNNSGKYVYLTEKKITQQGLNNSSTKLLQKDDIIISARGTVGEMAMIPFPMTFNQSCYGIRGNEDVNQHFLYYLIKYKIGDIKSKTHGSVFDTITKDTFENIICKIPSHYIQKQIAKILSSLDDKIALNTRINDNLEQQAENLYNELFANESVSGLINLGDVVETTSGGTPSRSNPYFYKKGTLNWVKSKELNGTFIINTEEFITDMAVRKSAAKMLPENSVLIAMYGATVGEYAIIFKQMACNQAICALLPSNNYPYTYLFMFAKRKKEELINKAIGSAQQNISQILVKQLSISKNIELIKKYDLIVYPFFEKIKKNVIEKESLSQLRDSLLSKLMSGELKINDLNNYTYGRK